jgi:deoxyxylulose-5-phosphate synthase
MRASPSTMRSAVTWAAAVASSCMRRISRITSTFVNRREASSR